ILFRPRGRLFVPISTLNSPSSGAVRSYDVSDGSFVNFEAPGTLGSAWYLTFRNTDPATLAYNAPADSAAALAVGGLSAASINPTPSSGDAGPSAGESVVIAVIQGGKGSPDSGGGGDHATTSGAHAISGDLLGAVFSED